MKRPPVALMAVGALALLALPLVLGGAVPETLTHLLVETKAGQRLAAPPTVTLASPEPGAGVTRHIDVVGEARSETATVLDVQYRVDGARWRSVESMPRDVPLAPFRFPLELETGARLVEVRAYDGAAFGMPARVEVRAGEPMPPTVRLLSPQDGAGVQPGPLAVEGTLHGEASRVTVRLGERSVDARIEALGGAAFRWTAQLDVPEGMHALEAQAWTAVDASAPARARIAAAPTPPPSLTLVTPEARAALGGAGDATCIDRCVRVAGTSERAARVDVSLDGGPALAATPVGGAWSVDVPLRGVYGGEHFVRATPVDAAEQAGVAHERAFLVVGERGLLVTGDDAPRLTRVPLEFHASGEGAHAARWRLDGAYVAEGSRAEVKLLTPGDHTLVVETRDADGALATRAVPLYAINRAPALEVEVVGAATAAEFTRMSARATDVDGRISHYLWDWGDGWADTTSGPDARHRYAREAVYRVNVTAVDDQGAHSHVVSLLVPVLNAPPVAGFSWAPPAPSTLDPVTFVDESADPEGTARLVEWDFGDGNKTTDKFPIHRFATRGNHTVTLRVVDEDGGVDLASRIVEVRNVPPDPMFSWSPADPVAGQEVLFADASAKPDGDIVQHRWSFSEGRNTTGDVVAHTFDAPGEHLVSLTVVDDWGARATRSLRVVVAQAPPNLSAIVVAPREPVAREEAVLTAVAFDLEGDVASVRWDFGDGAAMTCIGACPGEDGYVARHAWARSGTYAVTATAVDATGLEAALTRNVTVLNNAPTARLWVDGPAQAALPTYLRATATDADGRVVTYRFDADGNGVFDCEGARPACTFVYESARAHLAILDVEDDEGARHTTTLSIDVAEPPPSLAPPNVTVEAPVAGATLRGDVLLRGAASGARPIERVDVQLRNGTWTLSPSREAWALVHGREAWHLLVDTRSFPDGAYDLAVRAVDEGGAARVVLVPVRLANGEPEALLALQVVNLEAHAEVTRDLVVRGSAYHPGGVNAVRWRLDDGAWESALGVPVSWAVPLEGLRPGNHTLVVVAYHGLRETRELVLPFRVADTAPALTVDEPPNAIVYGVVRASGHVDAPARVLWRLDHHLWQELPPSLHWTLDETTLGWPGGAHSLSFKAVALDGGAESDVVEFPIRVIKLRQDDLPAPLPVHPDAVQGQTTPPAGAGALLVAVAAVALAARRRRGA